MEFDSHNDDEFSAGAKMKLTTCGNVVKQCDHESCKKQAISLSYMNEFHVCIDMGEHQFSEKLSHLSCRSGDGFAAIVQGSRGFSNSLTTKRGTDSTVSMFTHQVEEGPQLTTLLFSKSEEQNYFLSEFGS